MLIKLMDVTSWRTECLWRDSIQDAAASQKPVILLDYRPPWNTAQAQAWTVFMSVASLGGCMLGLCRNIPSVSSIIFRVPQGGEAPGAFSYEKEGCENFEFKLEKGDLERIFSTNILKPVSHKNGLDPFYFTKGKTLDQWVEL